MDYNTKEFSFMVNKLRFILQQSKELLVELINFLLSNGDKPFRS